MFSLRCIMNDALGQQAHSEMTTTPGTTFLYIQPKHLGTAAIMQRLLINSFATGAAIPFHSRCHLEFGPLCGHENAQASHSLDTFHIHDQIHR